MHVGSSSYSATAQLAAGTLPFVSAEPNQNGEVPGGGDIEIEGAASFAATVALDGAVEETSGGSSRKARRRRRRGRRKARRKRRRRRMGRFFKKLGNGLGKALSIVGKIGTFVGTALNFVLPGIGTLVATISSVAAQVGHALQHGIENFKEFLKMAGNVALDAVGSIPGVGQAVQIAVKAGKAVRAGVQAVKSLVADGVRGIASAVSSLASGVLGAMGARLPENVIENVGRATAAVESASNIGVGIADGDAGGAIANEALAWVARESAGSRLDERASNALDYAARSAGSLGEVVRGAREGDLGDVLLREATTWTESELGSHGMLSAEQVARIEDGVSYAVRGIQTAETLARGAREGTLERALADEASSWFAAEFGQHGMIGSERIGDVASYAARGVATVGALAQGAREGDLPRALFDEASGWAGEELGRHGALSSDQIARGERGLDYVARGMTTLESIADARTDGSMAEAILGEASEWFGEEAGQHGVLSQGGQERATQAADYTSRAASSMAGLLDAAGNGNLAEAAVAEAADWFAAEFGEHELIQNENEGNAAFRRAEREAARINQQLEGVRTAFDAARATRTR